MFASVVPRKVIVVGGVVNFVPSQLSLKSLCRIRIRICAYTTPTLGSFSLNGWFVSTTAVLGVEGNWVYDKIDFLSPRHPPVGTIKPRRSLSSRSDGPKLKNETVNDRHIGTHSNNYRHPELKEYTFYSQLLSWISRILSKLLILVIM